VHSGYGSIKYEEQSTAFGSNIESESSQDVILFGISGEYSFPGTNKFYTGITTDWAFGLKDEEKWRQDSTVNQSNDVRITAQFYDFRLGYKDSRDNLYYRLYVSGGWDGLHFKRDKFVWRGIEVNDTVSEDIGLWRAGIGAGLGYKMDKWALDGRAAYSYYTVAEIDNSALPQFEFRTEGACIDFGIGAAREIFQNTGFYFGGSYTLIKLQESDVMRSGSLQAVFPESRTEIITGVVNLTYSF
jgi:hypothetical protein